MKGILGKLFGTSQPEQYPITVTVTMNPPTFEEFILAGANELLALAEFDITYVDTRNQQREPFSTIYINGIQLTFNSETIFNRPFKDEELAKIYSTADLAKSNCPVTVSIEYPTTANKIPDEKYEWLMRLINEYSKVVQMPVKLNIKRVYARVY